MEKNVLHSSVSKALSLTEMHAYSGGHTGGVGVEGAAKDAGVDRVGVATGVAPCWGEGGSGVVWRYGGEEGKGKEEESDEGCG